MKRVFSYLNQLCNHDGCPDRRVVYWDVRSWGISRRDIPINKKYYPRKWWRENVYNIVGLKIGLI